MSTLLALVRGAHCHPRQDMLSNLLTTDFGIVRRHVRSAGSQEVLCARKVILRSPSLYTCLVLLHHCASG